MKKINLMNILIAEDDKLIAGSIRKNFTEEGHNVIIAEDGERALSILREIAFDILLLDWKMPKMEGITVCKRIRDSGNTIPIILITALSDVSNKIEALRLGADDYITKPFSFPELQARILAVLRRTNTGVDKITFEGIVLDLFGHTLYNNHKQVKLTDREFELLRYFLNHRGVIINKEVLTKEVWGISELPGSNVIEATVKNLRRKIEENFDKKLIKNIYGEGYSFVP